MGQADDDGIGAGLREQALAQLRRKTVKDAQFASQEPVRLGWEVRTARP
jgi:hypothetical protein